MGRYVSGDCPQLDAVVAEAIKGIGAEIDALKIPRLGGVVLGGGYGRGEGGVKYGKQVMQQDLQDRCENQQNDSVDSGPDSVNPVKSPALSNDLDFYVVTEDGATDADIAAIAEALKPVSEKWTPKLGVDVDFCVPKTPWRIKHDEARLMIQELIRGYYDVAGKKGDELFKAIDRRDSRMLPADEAARLMANRGVGLLLAKEPGRSRDFVVRNINKAVLGAGDAKLIAEGAYRWRLEGRAESVGDALYAKAAEWKVRPQAEAVCSWDEAREYYLAAADEIAQDRDVRKRSFYQAVRWVVRRKSLGNLATTGMEGIVRVFLSVKRVVEKRGTLGASLRRDWEVFN